ncbi:hypothetical protein QOT17_010568 [Balamuthia mandrillaris]
MKHRANSPTHPLPSPSADAPASRYSHSVITKLNGSYKNITHTFEHPCCKTGWWLVGLAFNDEHVAKHVLTHSKILFPDAPITRWWVGNIIEIRCKRSEARKSPQTSYASPSATSPTSELRTHLLSPAPKPPPLTPQNSQTTHTYLTPNNVPPALRSTIMINGKQLSISSKFYCLPPDVDPRNKPSPVEGAKEGLRQKKEISSKHYHEIAKHDDLAPPANRMSQYKMSCQVAVPSIEFVCFYNERLVSVSLQSLLGESTERNDLLFSPSDNYSSKLAVCRFMASTQWQQRYEGKCLVTLYLLSWNCAFIDLAWHFI